MKKWLLVAFSTIMVLAFLMAGCQSGKQPSADASSSQSYPTTMSAAGTTTASTAQEWNVVGKWTLRLVVTNITGQTIDHDYVIATEAEGAFAGTGGSPAGGPYTNHEIISGSIGAGRSSITMRISYNGTAYYADLTGTIDKNGEMNGTWKDNNTPQNTGTFSAINGAATLK
jgi:hypothetical protein